MARRRAAYRKRHQNRFSMFLVGLVVLMIMIAVTVKSVELRRTIDTYAVKEEQYLEQIAAEEQRAAEIEELRKYMQTKAYKKEVAEDKLGLVENKDVILFKEED